MKYVMALAVLTLGAAEVAAVRHPLVNLTAIHEQVNRSEQGEVEGFRRTPRVAALKTDSKRFLVALGMLKRGQSSENKALIDGIVRQFQAALDDDKSITAQQMHDAIEALADAIVPLAQRGGVFGGARVGSPAHNGAPLRSTEVSGVAVNPAAGELDSQGVVAREAEGIEILKKNLQAILESLEKYPQELRLEDYVPVIEQGNQARENIDKILMVQDHGLSADQVRSLEAIRQRLDDNLKDAQGEAVRSMELQAAAKVAVFVIQASLEIAKVMSMQTQALRFAEQPGLVVQRANYRWWGVRALGLSAALTAAIIATNATGYTDIHSQVLPDIATLFTSLTGLLGY